MMNVRSLASYKNKEIIEELEEFLRMAEAGEITAIAVVLKLGPNDHRAGMYGAYKKNPSEALQATFILEGKLRGELLPIYGGSL